MHKLFLCTHDLEFPCGHVIGITISREYKYKDVYDYITKCVLCTHPIQIRLIIPAKNSTKFLKVDAKTEQFIIGLVNAGIFT